MKFLNGWKTILGTVGTAATIAIATGGHVGEIGAKVAEFGQHADAVVGGAFGMLTILGVIHKREKMGQ